MLINIRQARRVRMAVVPMEAMIIQLSQNYFLRAMMKERDTHFTMQVPGHSLCGCCCLYVKPFNTMLTYTQIMFLWVPKRLQGPRNIEWLPSASVLELPVLYGTT